MEGRRPCAALGGPVLLLGGVWVGRQLDALAVLGVLGPLEAAPDAAVDGLEEELDDEERLSVR